METQRVKTSRLIPGSGGGNLPLDNESDVFEAHAEGPDSEIVKIQTEGDPATRLAHLEKMAELAPRFKAAVERLLVSQTFAADWQEFDGVMCLKSAGAERIGRNFDIRFSGVKREREEWKDAGGSAYRYIFKGYASLGGHVLYVEGAYGTRDAFLGKKGEKWRALEEINPSMISNAAMHIFQGNAVKGLLGIRGIPKDEWERMMADTGKDASKAGSYQHGRGTQGGTSQDDSAKQKELMEICIAFANAGKVVTADDKFLKFTLEDAFDVEDPIKLAEDCCVTLSTFIGQRGKVAGLPAKQLKQVRLDKTLEKARALKAQMGK